MANSKMKSGLGQKIQTTRVGTASQEEDTGTIQIWEGGKKEKFRTHEPQESTFQLQQIDKEESMIKRDNSGNPERSGTHKAEHHQIQR